MYRGNHATMLRSTLGAKSAAAGLLRAKITLLNIAIFQPLKRGKADTAFAPCRWGLWEHALNHGCFSVFDALFSPAIASFSHM